MPGNEIFVLTSHSYCVPVDSFRLIHATLPPWPSQTALYAGAVAERKLPPFESQLSNPCKKLSTAGCRGHAIVHSGNVPCGVAVLPSLTKVPARDGSLNPAITGIRLEENPQAHTGLLTCLRISTSRRFVINADKRPKASHLLKTRAI